MGARSANNAVERGDPLAIFRLDAIAARLDGSAAEAAAARQHGGHAALAGQLLRQAELRARLGGLDRQVPTANDVAPFGVQIIFFEWRDPVYPTDTERLKIYGVRQRRTNQELLVRSRLDPTRSRVTRVASRILWATIYLETE